MEDSMKIYVGSADLGHFFITNLDRLEFEQILIAENRDTDYHIYLDMDSGRNCILRVYYGDDDNAVVEDVEIVDQYDLEETARVLYCTYLIPGYAEDNYNPVEDPDCADCEAFTPPDIYEDGDDDSDDDEFSSEEEIGAIDDEIYEREDALSLAVNDLLDVFVEESAAEKTIVGGPNDEPKDKIIMALTDHICEWLAQEQGISVFRPTWLDLGNKTKNGNAYDELVRFPYEYLVNQEK